MKAISLWQPWASLWIRDRKKYETRHWTHKYRGWVAVHAAKKTLTKKELLALTPGLLAICKEEFSAGWSQEWRLPYGMIIGAVYLEEPIKSQRVFWEGLHAGNPEEILMGDFSYGRYAWPKSKVAPAPPGHEFLCTGRQSFFDLSDGDSSIVQSWIPST